MNLRCAAAAKRRTDPLLGTAAPATRWLLVEEPGGWGPGGVTDSPLDRKVAATLTARARELGARVQLIRRYGRRPGRSPLRRWAIADSRPGHETVRWGTVARDAALLDLQLDAELPVDDPAPGASEPTTGDPVYLVCTHGRRDVCCAVQGRPVVAALTGYRPDCAWETTHVGGDRFAANLVVLPHGLYFGHLTGPSALDVVAGYEAGRIESEHFRGRSAYPSIVQAAEHYVRLELGETGLDAIAPLATSRIDATTWRVRFGHSSGALDVTIGTALSAEPARLTCAAIEATHYRTYHLLAVERVEAA